MLALTAQAASALGERTLMAALDDAEFSAGAGQLGVIAMALQNLATTPTHQLRITRRSELKHGAAGEVTRVLDELSDHLVRRP